MRAQLTYLLYKVRTGFWFVPAVLLIAAVATSWVSVRIDGAAASTLETVWRDFNLHIGATGARALLTTIAASMITVASLVFSMTLVTMTLASTQFGPRLLERFMGDRVTQVALGTFLATFVFCIAVLLTISEEENTKEPILSVLVAVLLAVLSFGLLIAYIHRVAVTIRADSILARVESDMHAIMSDLLQDLSEDEAAEEGEDKVDTGDRKRFMLTAPADGYVQFIDHATLVGTAVEDDLFVRMRHRPGHYVVKGAPLAEVWAETEPSTACRQTMTRAVTFGAQRTLTQDMEFAISTLVEIAVRALSPGVNDHNTAITVVDRLTSALAFALRRGLPQSIMRGEDGAARVALSRISYEGLFDLAFHEIRQCAGDAVPVLIRQIESLIALSDFVRNEAQRKVLEKHAGILARAARREDREQCDRADMERRLEALEEALKSGQ